MTASENGTGKMKVLPPRKRHCDACDRDIDVRGWEAHQNKHNKALVEARDVIGVSFLPSAEWRSGYRAGFQDAQALAQQDEKVA